MKQNAAQIGLPLAASLGLFAAATPVPRSVIRIALHFMQFFGLFRLARYLTRHGLRIICYHGFAVADEYRYRSTLFIRDDLFRRRIDYLKRNGYPILPLQDALDGLAADRLPSFGTVITMDDGWRGVYTVGLPRGIGNYDLESGGELAEEAALQYGAALPPEERLAFLKELAQALDVSFDEIDKKSLFRVMDEAELRALAAAGVDIQLHSHRHHWPLDDRQRVASEINENRRFLQRVASSPLEHFCYPSGVYGLHQAEWLADLGVKSATTIEPGLNYRDTPRFALRRLVDGGRVSDIEFAAEMTGFMEIVRWLRRRLNVMRGLEIGHNRFARSLGREGRS